MSFKAEVIADSSGTWAGNALRFETRMEAQVYVADLERRWTLVRDTRVVQSDDPVSHQLQVSPDGRLHLKRQAPETAA